jgi:protein subunit release factor B
MSRTAKGKLIDSFHVTWDDVEWSFTASGGKGGQNVNKVATKARCTHKPSGATGVDASTRSQHTNRGRAFVKMAETARFKDWARIEAARRQGRLEDIDAAVEAQLKKIKVERRGPDGKWQEWKDESDEQQAVADASADH